MLFQWRTQFWQSLEEGVRKRQSDPGSVRSIDLHHRILGKRAAAVHYASASSHSTVCLQMHAVGQMSGSTAASTAPPPPRSCLVPVCCYLRLSSWQQEKHAELCSNLFYVSRRHTCGAILSASCSASAKDACKALFYL